MRSIQLLFWYYQKLLFLYFEPKSRTFFAVSWTGDWWLVFNRKWEKRLWSRVSSNLRHFERKGEEPRLARRICEVFPNYLPVSKTDHRKLSIFHKNSLLSLQNRNRRRVCITDYYENQKWNTFVDDFCKTSNTVHITFFIFHTFQNNENNAV